MLACAILQTNNPSHGSACNAHLFVLRNMSPGSCRVRTPSGLPAAGVPFPLGHAQRRKAHCAQRRKAQCADPIRSGLGLPPSLRDTDVGLVSDRPIVICKRQLRQLASPLVVPNSHGCAVNPDCVNVVCSGAGAQAHPGWRTLKQLTLTKDKSYRHLIPQCGTVVVGPPSARTRCPRAAPTHI